MNLGMFSYLITMLIFAGSGFVLTLILVDIRPYKKLIGVVLAIGLVYAIITEPIAVSWQAWEYSQKYTLGYYVFGAELETCIFAVLAAIAIAGETLVFAEVEEKGGSLIAYALRSIKYKLRIRVKR
jgi:hypothetical protein